MEEIQRLVVIARLVDALRRHGSWCGETHVQKAMYLLQTLCAVPTGFSFVLYKHGPFSFDLRDTLNQMLGSGLLDIEQRQPYGPTMIRTGAAERLEEGFPKTIGSVDGQIEFVGQLVGDSGVAELEREATAAFLVSQTPDRPDQGLAEELTRLKPHVTIDEALRAVRDLRQSFIEAKAVVSESYSG
jgi:hypothetical protein